MKQLEFLMQLQEAREAQDRKDLLHWQNKLMDVFPDSYDVGFAVRAPWGSAHPAGSFNVITVSRNGKELFYFDTRRSSNSFYSSMEVCGDHVRSFAISVKDLQKSINELMLMYEFQRKIGNLMSDARCFIVKNRAKANTLIIEITSTRGFTGEFVKVEYELNNMTYHVKVQALYKGRTIGSTKDMTKALDLVETAFKSLG